jgi:hypothetical protein
MKIHHYKKKHLKTLKYFSVMYSFCGGLGKQTPPKMTVGKNAELLAVNRTAHAVTTVLMT